MDAAPNVATESLLSGLRTLALAIVAGQMPVLCSDVVVQLALLPHARYVLVVVGNCQLTCVDADWWSWLALVVCEPAADYARTTGFGVRWPVTDVFERVGGQIGAASGGLVAGPFPEVPLRPLLPPSRCWIRQGGQASPGGRPVVRVPAWRRRLPPRSERQDHLGSQAGEADKLWLLP
jgi:hypothetical protein